MHTHIGKYMDMSDTYIYWLTVTYTAQEMATAIRNHLNILRYAEYQIHHHGNYRCDLRIEDMLKEELCILSMKDIILVF